MFAVPSGGMAFLTLGSVGAPSRDGNAEACWRHLLSACLKVPFINQRPEWAAFESGGSVGKKATHSTNADNSSNR